MRPSPPLSATSPTPDRPSSAQAPIRVCPFREEPMSTNPRPQLSADPSGATSQGMPDARRRRTILIAVCIALMAVIASVSGLNVAQPDLAVAFDASQNTILWIINIYTLGLAALLLPLGAIGDRLGRKPVLLAGLTVFGVASTVAGLAPSAEVMLAAR